MSAWDALSAQMDREVDAALGDTIQLALNGTSFVDQPGFVLTVGSTDGLAGFDEILGSRIRVKMAKSIIGEDEPSRDIRLKAAKLGADTYRPAGSKPDDQGRYWLFDIQKA